MNDHAAQVSIISAQVKSFHAQNVKFRIYHGATNSTRPSPRHRETSIDTSRLSNVLKIDKAAKTALVEPNCPMDQLVKATLAVGLVPPVVPEFPGITAGGGFAGTAGESSSFKYGFLDATVDRIEIVLADGRVLNASRSEHQDLFYGAAGSLGTLGVLTLLEMRLIDAAAYIELTYRRVDGFAAAVETIQRATAEPACDFVDAIMFGSGAGAVMTGRLTDDGGGGKRIARFTRWHDPWFYLHAKRQISKKQRHGGPPPKASAAADEPEPEAASVVECIPLVDYLFRYDRGGFWVGALAFRYFCAPFNRITRGVLDALMHTRVLYHALHASGVSERYIIEDLAVPVPRAVEFLEYVDAETGIYPLWLCPLKMGRSGLVPRRLVDDEGDDDDDDARVKMLLNVGIWGRGPKRIEEFVAKNRRLEDKVKELRGAKWLYSMAFYTEQEFWDIYDEKAYADLRAKYNATNLPTVYDKIRHTSQARTRRRIRDRRPFPGLYAVWKVLVGGREYILTAKSKST